MPIYIECPHCRKKIIRGTKCNCGYRRDYEKPVGTRKLYHTRRWQDLRKTVLAIYGGLDPYAKSLGRLEYAETVHHIIPAEENEGLFWTLGNLIPLSRHSHDEVHVRYRQSEESKAKLQSLLRSLLKEPNW